MNKTDNYGISIEAMDLPYIYTSGKAPSLEDGLEGGLEQDYLWECPLCNKKVKITGPSKITFGIFDEGGSITVKLYTDYHAGGEPLVFPYEGKAYLTNVVLTPPSIPADGKSTSDASVTIGVELIL